MIEVYEHRRYQNQRDVPPAVAVECERGQGGDDEMQGDVDHVTVVIGCDIALGVTFDYCCAVPLSQLAAQLFRSKIVTRLSRRNGDRGLAESGLESFVICLAWGRPDPRLIRRRRPVHIACPVSARFSMPISIGPRRPSGHPDREYRSDRDFLWTDTP